MQKIKLEDASDFLFDKVISSPISLIGRIKQKYMRVIFLIPALCFFMVLILMFCFPILIINILALCQSIINDE